MKNKRNSNYFEIDRRLLVERRLDHTISKFPMRLQCGTMISGDRRSIPERRLRKIVVSEQNIQDDEFNKLFKKFTPL